VAGSARQRQVFQVAAAACRERHDVLYFEFEFETRSGARQYSHRCRARAATIECSLCGIRPRWLVLLHQELAPYIVLERRSSASALDEKPLEHPAPQPSPAIEQFGMQGSKLGLKAGSDNQWNGNVRQKPAVLAEGANRS